MRITALITTSVLIAFLLNIPKVGISAETIAHYGQIVENSGDPHGCIACHDGLTASDAHFCTVECGFGRSHSISKEYPPRSKESSFAPVESLQKKGIRLFNGKVSCVSCHDLTKSTKYNLIMEDSGSAICFACHRI